MKHLFVFLFLCGCTQFRKGPELSDTAKEVPNWIYAPYESCVEAAELCATGEGKTYAEADAQAKGGLGSIFEVKVQSELNVTTQSTQSFPWQSEVRQEVQQSLKESVDQVLETVQVKKRFKKDKLSYSLASLDRQKASDLIAGRMDKLDQELEVLWQGRQRTSMRKIVRLSMERDKLNERYSIVAGQGKPAKVTYAKVLAWKNSRPVTAPLTLKVNQAPDWLTEKLKELLTEAGFKLVKEQGKVLTVNVDSLKEYLNVSGFEKYTFTLNLSTTEKGEKQKVISTSETVTGRSQADALLKVKPLFTEYLEQHLSDLNLD